MRHQDNTGKFIAFILRHHPESIGMKLDGHGWARTEDLIAGIAKSRPFDMQMLEEIVRTDFHVGSRLFSQFHNLLTDGHTAWISESIQSY